MEGKCGVRVGKKVRHHMVCTEKEMVRGAREDCWVLKEEFWLQGEEKRIEGGRCCRDGEKRAMTGWRRERVCQ
jgi:hypothetical protein